jgi:hypothetical protein
MMSGKRIARSAPAEAHLGVDCDGDLSTTFKRRRLGDESKQFPPCWSMLTAMDLGMHTPGEKSDEASVDFPFSVKQAPMTNLSIRDVTHKDNSDLPLLMTHDCRTLIEPCISVDPFDFAGNGATDQIGNKLDDDEIFTSVDDEEHGARSAIQPNQDCNRTGSASEEQRRLDDKNRKGRERSLRTRERNLARMKELQESCIHLQLENERIKNGLVDVVLHRPNSSVCRAVLNYITSLQVGGALNECPLGIQDYMRRLIQICNDFKETKEKQSLGHPLAAGTARHREASKLTGRSKTCGVPQGCVVEQTVPSDPESLAGNRDNNNCQLTSC